MQSFNYQHLSGHRQFDIRFRFRFACCVFFLPYKLCWSNDWFYFCYYCRDKLSIDLIALFSLHFLLICSVILCWITLIENRRCMCIYSICEARHLEKKKKSIERSIDRSLGMWLLYITKHKNPSLFTTQLKEDDNNDDDQ